MIDAYETKTLTTAADIMVGICRKKIDPRTVQIIVNGKQVNVPDENEKARPVNYRRRRLRITRVA